MSFILSMLGGVWGYVAAAVVAGALAASGTYYVVHNADEVAIGKLKLAASMADTASVKASMTELQGFITSMHLADAGYQADMAGINDHFATVEKEFANAKISKPLPVDCKPDAGRLRVLTDAVAAANGGTTTP